MDGLCVQKELVQMQSEVQKRIQVTKKTLMELPHVARQHKVSNNYDCYLAGKPLF